MISAYAVEHLLMRVGWYAKAVQITWKKNTNPGKSKLMKKRKCIYGKSKKNVSKAGNGLY